MITKLQAVEGRVFHYKRSATTCDKWRRNGATQTWKTRPNNFRVPVKYGLYDYGQIRETDAEYFHMVDECPHRGVTQ